MFLYDFFFELEAPEWEKGDKSKLAEKIENPEYQPSPKKQRTELGRNSEGTSHSKFPSSTNAGGAGRYGKNTSSSLDMLVRSAPPKITSSKIVVQAKQKRSLRVGLDDKSYGKES